MKKTEHNALIIGQERLNSRVLRLVLQAPSAARQAVPGQFLMVKTGADDDPLLRRPISIHRRNNNGIELLYEVVGKGTFLLSGMKPGSSLDIIGPLGRGFPLEAAKSRVPVLIGGGIGVAPLLFLAEELVRKDRSEQPVVLLGGRNKKDLLCVEKFRRAGCRVYTATDDGTCGRKGFVSCLLEDLLKDWSGRRMVVYSCGPRAMLNSIYALSDTAGIPAYVSLEAHMACGIGACMGCAVSTVSGNKRVCKDGPVFDAQDILWGHADED